MNEKTFRTEVAKSMCKQCQVEIIPVLSKEPHALHGYKRLCPVCGAFCGWNGKEKALKTTDGKRTKSSNWTVKGLNIDYCQMCLRPKKFLANGDTLEIHHIKPVKDGGKDDPDNINVLCTSCHKIVHHRRTYFYEHMKPFFEAYEAWKAQGN